MAVEHGHGLSGSELFGIFFPRRGSSAERLAVAGNLDDEGLFVLCALFGDDRIKRRGELARLGVLDQAAFVVVLRFDKLVQIDLCDDVVRDETLGSGEALVEVDGADQRLQGIGKRRFAGAYLLLVGGFADDKVLAELQFKGECRKGFAVDDLGPVARQVPLVTSGKLLEEVFGDQEVKHRVAEKFETLVRFRFIFFAVVVVQDGAMRQRCPVDQAVARTPGQACEVRC